MMKYQLILILTIFIASCTNEQKQIPAESSAPATDPMESRIHIAALLDSFNVAAANADFDRYFSYYDDDAIFIGTDATENWNKQEFMEWAKPYFDKGKVWNFTSMERNIYFDATGNTAWFDELLNTQMKICRGSGVLVRHGADWKIKQYVLSMTVPNDSVDAVVAIKAVIEDQMIRTLRGEK